MKIIFFALYATVGALTYKNMIFRNFENYMPNLLLFFLFSLIWIGIIYIFVCSKNAILKKVYKQLKNNIYESKNKSDLYAKLLFDFFIIIALCCYIYFHKAGDSKFSDWISFVASVVTILGIPTFFSGFFVNSDLKENRMNAVQITERNIYGWIVMLSKDENSSFKGKKFKTNESSKVLYVQNYLNNFSGDNLWIPMNEWYKGASGIGKYYPLINAQENNWHGNKEWAEQLNAFIEYLKSKEQIVIEDK